MRITIYICVMDIYTSLLTLAIHLLSRAYNAQKGVPECIRIIISSRSVFATICVYLLPEIFVLLGASYTYSMSETQYSYYYYKWKREQLLSRLDSFLG